MRWIILGVVLGVTACAPRPTLQQLEEEAIVTGDWSKVHRREDKIRERLQANVPNCPNRLVMACIEEGMRTACYCLRPVSR